MTKYFRIWKNKYITQNAKNINDFIEIFESLILVLKKWKSEGKIYLDPDSNIEDDQAIFITTDMQTANEGGFKQDITDELEKLNSNFNHNEKEDGTRLIVENYKRKKEKETIAGSLHDQQSNHEEWMKLTEDERWAEIQKTLNYEKKIKEKYEKWQK